MSLAKNACTYCGEPLDTEEAANPERDGEGDVMCDSCYDDKYGGDCCRCGDRVDKTDLSTEVGSLIIMMEETDSDLPVGYYAIERRPFFVDAMFSGWFISGALRRVAYLDARGQRAAQNRCSASGPMCLDCQRAVKALVAELGVQP